MSEVISHLSFRGAVYAGAGDDEISSSLHTWRDEENVREKFWMVKEGDWIFDVGCGSGSYTMPGLALGAAFAHAWAPHPLSQRFINRSLQLNGWTGRCRVHVNGLHEHKGHIQDFAHPDGMDVDILDALLPDLPSKMSPWLKIDTEGHELAILMGARDFLVKYNAQVILENHDFIVPGISEKCRRWMAALGYQHVETMPAPVGSHSLYRRNA